MPALLAAIAAACLLATVLYGLGRLAARKRPPAPGDARRQAAAPPGARSCPLCGSALGPGERVKSSLFPGKADRIMHIYGCPHCWPPVAQTPRRCPVCGGTLGADAWVVARYFERPAAAGAARRHVHVLGCADCHG